LSTVLLSGDGGPAVARLAHDLGIPAWHAVLLPEAKVDFVRAWAARHGAIAMVGDGLNDGPVLAAATVGIAVGGASDLARESADVTLPEGGLGLLPWLLQLAREVRRSVHVNLLWALGYNAVALALAAAGLLQPVLAAALMAGSSLLVVLRTVGARHGHAARDAGLGDVGRAPAASGPVQAQVGGSVP
jgi:Cu2+-exporting ATPase